MKFSVEFVFRLIGMVVFAFVGWSFGGWAARIPPFDPGQELLYRVVFGLVGALAGLVLTPYITTRPSRYIRNRLGRLPSPFLNSPHRSVRSCLSLGCWRSLTLAFHYLSCARAT
jgi:uncharacterized membrane protein YeaQ/YmgE (transglycosylase-associated protein family)